MKISKRNALLILFDLFCFAGVSGVYYILSHYIPNSPSVSFTDFLLNIAVLCVLTTIARIVLGIYTTVWRYSSTQSYFRLLLADIISGILTCLVVRFFPFYMTLWPFVLLITLDLIVVLTARYTYRLIYKKLKTRQNSTAERTNVAIIGAGQLGAFLANELYNNPNSSYRPVCFIDTNTAKTGSKIAGLRVYPPEKFAQARSKFGIDEVVIAIANADNDKLARMHAHYSKVGCKVKLYDLPMQDAEGEEPRRVIREFQIEDLLFRTPLNITGSEAAAYYKGKTILVTGGGGSIGSELCRQISKCRPKQLIIFDIYENNAYDIQQELIRKYGERLNLCVEIGSVRDPKRLDYVFNLYHPDIVFHAAAHKHVPLMEHCPIEAVKNNCIGTYNTANAAERYGAERFILISTDKAVNPISIMGASKRMCEMIVGCRKDSHTVFSSVRFGNVLASDGSVIPLFKEQIESGGPVTVTDKRMVRYFMTVNEAAGLVIKAGAGAAPGEVYVLDLGKPVSILELAKNMIKQYGLAPGVDIEIKEIGIRPGEKLSEELMSENAGKGEESDIIHVEKESFPSRERIDCDIRELKAALSAEREARAESVVKALIKAVPTYRVSET